MELLRLRKSGWQCELFVPRLLSRSLFLSGTLSLALLQLSYHRMACLNFIQEMQARKMGAHTNSE